MDNYLPMDDQKQALRAKFRGHQKLKSKYIPLYPDSSEREMRRISNAYMKIVSEELKAILPEIMDAYDREIRHDAHEDGLWDLGKKITDSFSRATETIRRKTEDFDLGEMIGKAATGIRRSAVREWKRAVGKTLGVEIDEEFYKDEMYREAMDEWVRDRTDAFKEVPTEVMMLVRKKIEEGYQAGTPTSKIKKEIQHIYSTARQTAADNAAGSVSLLNYEVSRKTQEDAGVREYMWYTRRDSKVRACHASFDGKIFRWDGPPEIWYQTKHEGKVWTGRYCGPGQDYNCRCRAVPVFKREELSLPIAKQQRKKV